MKEKTVTADRQSVIIVDDDEGVLDSLRLLMSSVDLPCRLYTSAQDLLNDLDELPRGCFVLDIRMPGMSGLELQDELNRRGNTTPTIFITAHGDIVMAVEAMRKGAMDFISKPFREQDLLDRIHEALAYEAGKRRQLLEHAEIMAQIETLSNRERQVFEMIADGQSNKVTAYKLGVSERTVEVHRAKAMKKLGAKSLADLVRVRIESQRPLFAPVASLAKNTPFSEDG